METAKLLLKTIPSVDSLLSHTGIKHLTRKYRYELVIKVIRKILNSARDEILNGEKTEAATEDLVNKINSYISELEKIRLQPVINGTGIILHTNLGRASLGKDILKEIAPVICNYTNLEFDLSTGKRGKRKSHFSRLITDLLGVEDFAIVNNNAAAVFLSLKALAQDKEVIVSRGELIEIGDSFRIPDIMNLSGARMIEVGATNKTKLSDYENAIGPETAVLFKTHRSNFSMRGFTGDVSFGELAKLAKKKKLISMCDVGSGLLFKQNDPPLQKEISVEEIIQEGIDLIMFSGDKLLGGPQCGIIVGKKALINKIEKHPLMRTYRVAKMTIVALISILKGYLYPIPCETLNPVLFNLQMVDRDQILEKAKTLKEKLVEQGYKASIVANKVQCGGGTLPDSFIESYALEVFPVHMKGEELYLKLLALDKPIVSFLRKGVVMVDLFCVEKSDISYLAHSLNNICRAQ